MTDPSHRIFIRKIQIRAKSAAPNHPTPTPITISLKASGSILRQKDSRTWSDISWKFRPPVELHADSEVSIVISPAPSATALSFDEQVLATITVADVLALPRRNARRVHLQLEHDLATVSICFTLTLNQGPPVPLWDALKLRVLRYCRALFRGDEGSDAAPTTPPPAPAPGANLEIPEQQAVPSARPGWLRPSVGEHVRPPPSQLRTDNLPQESHIDTENDFNAVPVDSGKIQYTVVGTKRPKPR